MGYSRAYGAFVVALCLSARAMAQNGPVTEQVPLFPTRQPSFDIPFQIDEPIPGQEPVEVQLHTSDDQGASWKPTSKVSPEAGRFSFRAPKDAEYWFLVRTLNRQGKLLPDRPFAAEMKVLVDTEPPRLELTCNRGSAGEVYCIWKTADPYLKPESLQLTYQGIDGGPQWQTVAVAPSTQGADGVWSGRTTFVPLGVKWPMFARMEVSDVAGNRATAQVQVESGPGAGPQSMPLASTPVGASPFASSTNPGSNSPSDGWQAGKPATSPRLNGVPSPFFSTPATPAVPASNGLDSPPLMSSTFPNRALPSRSEAVPKTAMNGRPSTGAPAGELVPPRTAETIPLPAAADSASPYRTTSKPNPASPQPFHAAEAEALPPPETLSEPARRTLESATPFGASVPKNAAGPDLGPSFGGPTGNTSPELASPELASPRETPKPALDRSSTPLNDFGDESTPPGVNPRMVNSRRFELEYDVESTGAAGVAKVELWATRDAGRTWTKSSNDPDAKSPYVVSVDEEGIYGFRIVIETTTGVRSPTPKPGDLPEVWVGVDITKPTARIVSVQQRGDEQGVLLDIRWEADDRLLPARPISLSFAETADGPWTTIVSGLPNTHSYDWRFDTRTPERLFVKLDVRDVAGNAASYVTPDPVLVERVRPTGRIRGVRPVGESARLKMPSQILPR